MTIELRVPGRAQATQMSCWWTCMAMVLEYYGRDYDLPWQYRSEFRRPLSFGPRGADAEWHVPSLDEALARDGTLASTGDMIYLAPHEWYERGLPAHRAAFDRLASITEFRGLPSRPAFGEWTATDVEDRLRAHGPYVFFGSWNNFPHAIVIAGLIPGSKGPQVVTIDPVRGFPTQVDLLAFNKQMTQRMADFNFDDLNPMYLPQENPVRGIINHDE
ncbi:MAG: hypothetical protein JNN03_01865 [Rubrivivax sp.]|nr:hypothetical protein [Rubrivivax sp.]